MITSRRTLIAIALLAVALVAGVWLVRAPLRAFSPEGRTTVSQDLVVQEVRSVAKLVTSETTIRDVVVWQNTQYGSTKRALVVVTGKVLAGFDLSAAGTNVTVNDTTHTITIALPAPKVIAVDVTQMRTYDEQSGLWNWFHPADQDEIYKNARAHLMQSASEMGMAERAGRSAIEMLQRMFSTNGYTAVVTVAGLPPVQRAD